MLKDGVVRNSILMFFVLLVAMPLAIIAQNQQCVAVQATKYLVSKDAARAQAYEESKAAANKNANFDGLHITIPVVFHVAYVADSGVENIPDSQIVSQIDILNEDYGRYGPGFNSHDDGADTKIRFCLATIDPDGNPTTGINRFFYPNTYTYNYLEDDSTMKAMVSWDPTRYMNIYTVGSIGGFGGIANGFAYFPAGAINSVYDGVVLDYKQVGRVGPLAISQGRTATHEVGHYLNLHHPWGTEALSCCDEDDYVDDTPCACGPHWDCSDTSGCGCERQLENYMDYTPDFCKNMFTKGQAYRMWYAIAKYRPNFLRSENLALTGCDMALDTITETGELFIFPNPSEGSVVINYDLDTIEYADIEVIDLRGRKVLSFENQMLERGGTVLDLSGLGRTTYFIILRTPSRYLRGEVTIVD